MALTGVVLYGFALVHMAGNLQFLLGQEKFDAYAHGLQAVPALVWGVRVLLLGSVVLHIVAALSLTARKRAARPHAYKRHGRVAASYAASSMFWGGLALLAFLVFHILHFTTGQAHPSFVAGDAFGNVVRGFTVVPVAIAYMLAMFALALHLYHGVSSGFQTLGLNHPKYTPRIKLGAKLFAVVVTLGFVTIPIAVLAGFGAAS